MAVHPLTRIHVKGNACNRIVRFLSGIVVLFVPVTLLSVSIGAFAIDGRSSFDATHPFTKAAKLRHSTPWWGSSSLFASASNDVEINGTAAKNHNKNGFKVDVRWKDDEISKPNVKTSDVLSLDSIRSTLIRQEETIIFSLIERAQFRRNAVVYKPGAFGADLGVSGNSAPEGTALSFLESFIIGTETLHCGLRRYTSPEEHAFFPDYLPSGPIDALSELEYPDLLSSKGGANEVNFNSILLDRYFGEIIPSITKVGDDEQYGSTCLSDIAVLQALSRRVHYGKFVAESKYQDKPEEYQRLVEAGDAEGVMELLTNTPVELKILRRVRHKAANYGREPLDLPEVGDHSDKAFAVAAAAASAAVGALEAIEGTAKDEGKINPFVIETIYRDLIIPLTKDIEVAYLFLRCGKQPPPQYRPKPNEPAAYRESLNGMHP
mmetsp:Transcript_11120/g.16263  ORF Transcript_11120/g.16263 Transcript_11120/m.16263 type:complete len:435 (-) Transcript_11120:247-1551(-)|eukprot:CAMPEP_0195527948 /NCGR_PEP_ID=MMETSP0794_2-20130614/29884_1 /TAXON_ID=515487 /ORGANISM="Stephanopyxis turris, Strain CCMP 815" /LENGTH=434 /DNA_ID=CAMNT_0040658973 /DNA_START=39 /DNA_END=1343 /DNA_ORIENTATION=+